MARTFTLQEANELIPRLTELLTKMRTLRDQLDALRRSRPERPGRSGNGYVDPQREADMRRGEALAGEVNSLFEEVGGLGCELKGLDEGLVDFPSERDGRLVYLCWKLGEERVAYWHELDAGFAGRQPL